MSVQVVKHLQNFGRNLNLNPTAYYEPRTEHEVLEILNVHRGEAVRAIGSLHSWSAALVGTGVVISLRFLNQVEVQAAANRAIVGAGCQIKTLLEHLNRQQKTLPSVGLTIARSSISDGKSFEYTSELSAIRPPHGPTRAPFERFSAPCTWHSTL